MHMTPFILNAAQWLLDQAGGKLFNTVTDNLAVKMGIKPEPLTVPQTRVLLEDYLQHLEDRLARRVIARLDEDRLIKLKSGIVQLKRSSRTTAQRESLVNALSSFSDIISLPEQGKTGGFPNVQLRSIAFLGIAAAHIALQDSQSVIAENIAAAVYADTPTANQWLGEDLVRNLLIHNPYFRSSSTAQHLPKVTLVPRSPTAKVSPPPKSFSTVGATLLIYRGHSSVVRDVTWSPDGSRIASASSDGTVQIWEITTGRILLTYQDQNVWTEKVAWSPDGKGIASGDGGGGLVKVWNAATGHNMLTYRGHDRNISSLAWSPNGKQILSVTYFDIHVWPATLLHRTLKHQMLDSNYHIFGGRSAAWSPNGKRIVSSAPGQDKKNLYSMFQKEYKQVIQIWDTSNGRPILTTYRDNTLGGIPPGAGSLAWSPDGKRIASSADGQGAVDIWDPVTGNMLLTYHGHTDSLYKITWSPDGIRIASCGHDKTVHVWDATTGNTILTYEGHSGWLEALSWSPDGTRIASGGQDQTVQVWQAI